MMNIPMRWQPKDSMECTAACTSMLLGSRKRRIPRRELVRRLGITRKRGPGIRRFLKVLREVGFSPRTTRLGRGPITLPAVACVDVGRLWGFDQPWRGSHVVVLLSLNERFAVINDPYPGYGGREIKLPRHKFEHALIRSQNNIILIE